VGMLYVGYLERPFTLLKYAALAGIGVVFFAVMIVAAVVSLRWARTIFAPIERREATMQVVEGGDLDARVGLAGSGDEIGRLAQHLDRLLDVLQRWNAGLDAKVAERTRELAQAQGQLLRSEKLAAVGQLTASIAHEINNPIAVIQGNLDVLRTQLPPEAARASHEELRLIDEQVERMRLIVTQLLQFARPAEYAGYVAPVDTARVAEDCLVLVGHLLAKTRIALVRDFAATRQPALNRNELQQVLVNLLVNAIHAMPEGGTLALSTRDDDAYGDDAVAITVADSGPGLDAELMDQLFQPFVTRKKDGTGLGLWISRTLVQRYGGDLRAANRPEGGAAFTVLLRREPQA
jgi:two-component system NtrC family sensor kinase